MERFWRDFGISGGRFEHSKTPLGTPMISSMLGTDSRFLSPPTRPDQFWGPHNLPYSHHGLFPSGVKWPEREAHYSPPSRVKVKNERKCTSAPSYTFKRWERTALSLPCSAHQRFPRLQTQNHWPGGSSHTPISYLFNIIQPSITSFAKCPFLAGVLTKILYVYLAFPIRDTCDT